MDEVWGDREVGATMSNVFIRFSEEVDQRSLPKLFITNGSGIFQSRKTELLEVRSRESANGLGRIHAFRNSRNQASAYGSP